LIYFLLVNRFDKFDEMQKSGFTQTEEIKQKFKESLLSSRGTLGILENKLDILPDFVYKVRFHGAENSGISF
jgi:hypothetical protein